jgi:tRNA pseudouridine38-40 synthase
LNRQLGPEIAVGRIEPVGVGFSARFDATERAYTYLVLNRETPGPFLAPFSWLYPTPLDVDQMNLAAGHFIGEHDFASLCRKAGERSTVRVVRRAEWSRRDEDLLAFDVAASSFCHQMVRSMVALGVEVGRGRLDPDDVPVILGSGDRHAAKGAAPPHGLTLVAVRYGD